MDRKQQRQHHLEEAKRYLLRGEVGVASLHAEEAARIEREIEATAASKKKLRMYLFIEGMEDGVVYGQPLEMTPAIAQAFAEKVGIEAALFDRADFRALVNSRRDLTEDQKDALIPVVDRMEKAS